MAAVTISSDQRFASSLAYVKARAGGTLTARGSRVRLVINDAPQRVIAEVLSDIIVTDLKSHYIESQIHLPSDDQVITQAFIRALSTFDRETEKIIAKSIIKVTPNIYLDSLYEFTLDTLKTRWNEVCNLANENTCYLACPRTFMELLRFLISNIESLSDEAHVIQVTSDKGQVTNLEVLGRGLKPFKDIYINESLPPDVKVISKLVTIAPKRVFLHGDYPKLQESINNLFGSCVLVN